MYKVIANGVKVAETRDLRKANTLVDLFYDQLQIDCYLEKEEK